MKIRDPLNKILDNETKVKVLRFLCLTGAQWNGRQIAKEIGITPATAHKALNSLNRQGVLLLYNVGKNHIYSLNTDNFVVTDMLIPLFSAERKVLNNIVRIIRNKVSSSKVKKEIVTIALFGSVNIQKDHVMSDIDLAVVVENVKVKNKVEKLFEEIDQIISKKFGNTVSPYVSTRAEFKYKHKKKMGIICNILKENTIIYGDKPEKLL